MSTILNFRSLVLDYPSTNLKSTLRKNLVPLCTSQKLVCYNLKHIYAFIIPETEPAEIASAIILGFSRAGEFSADDPVSVARSREIRPDVSQDPRIPQVKQARACSLQTETRTMCTRYAAPPLF